MKIVSDDSSLLDEIHDRLKIARVKVKKEKKIIEGAMAGEITIALEIVHQVKEHYDNVAFIIAGIRELDKYLTSSIKVEKKDGTFISFNEYQNMTDEERKDIF